MPPTSREELQLLMAAIRRVNAGQDPDWNAGGRPHIREMLREYMMIWREAEQDGN